VEPVLRSKGLRLSIAGIIIFLASTAALAVAAFANGISLAGMMVGGTMVWGGFIWTLVQWYAAHHEEGV
jgi:hypothetical protein